MPGPSTEDVPHHRRPQRITLGDALQDLGLSHIDCDLSDSDSEDVFRAHPPPQVAQTNSKSGMFRIQSSHKVGVPERPIPQPQPPIQYVEPPQAPMEARRVVLPKRLSHAEMNSIDPSSVPQYAAQPTLPRTLSRNGSGHFLDSSSPFGSQSFISEPGPQPFQQQLPRTLSRPSSGYFSDTPQGAYYPAQHGQAPPQQQYPPQRSRSRPSSNYSMDAPSAGVHFAPHPVETYPQEYAEYQHDEDVVNAAPWMQQQHQQHQLLQQQHHARSQSLPPQPPFSPEARKQSVSTAGRISPVPTKQALDLSGLSEEDQVRLTLRLSKQESKYGKNMFDDLEQINPEEIETLESFGFDFKDAVEMIFKENNDVVQEVVKDDHEAELVQGPEIALLPDAVRHSSILAVSSTMSMIDNPLRRKPSNSNLNAAERDEAARRQPASVPAGRDDGVAPYSDGVAARTEAKVPSPTSKQQRLPGVLKKTTSAPVTEPIPAAYGGEYEQPPRPPGPRKSKSLGIHLGDNGSTGPYPDNVTSPTAGARSLSRTSSLQSMTSRSDATSVYSDGHSSPGQSQYSGSMVYYDAPPPQPPMMMHGGGHSIRQQQAALYHAAAGENNGGGLQSPVSPRSHDGGGYYVNPQPSPPSIRRGNSRDNNSVGSNVDYAYGNRPGSASPRSGAGYQEPMYHSSNASVGSNNGGSRHHHQQQQGYYSSNNSVNGQQQQHYGQQQFYTPQRGPSPVPPPQHMQQQQQQHMGYYDHMEQQQFNRPPNNNLQQQHYQQPPPSQHIQPHGQQQFHHYPPQQQHQQQQMQYRGHVSSSSSVSSASGLPPARGANPAMRLHQLRVSALANLSEPEQLQLSIVLSTQDDDQGTNMFDSLVEEDIAEIDHWLSRRYKFDRIAFHIFQHKFGLPGAGPAPQMT